MVDDKKSATKDKPAKEVVAQPSGNGKAIAIAVLATALVCLIVTVAVLLCTGVVKFSNDTDGDDPQDTSTISRHDRDGRGYKDTKGNDGLVDNPYDRVEVKGKLVEVDNLEFYLPNKFDAGGKNKDGAHTYNLTNDDGWAQVLVYAEKSSLSPTSFLKKISGDSLDITDEDYEINGTEWVQGENASVLAYATKLKGKIYAVYYAVKIDSKATSEAMQMIPKTLYMKKIEASEVEED